jgi:hypothetical protein
VGRAMGEVEEALQPQHRPSLEGWGPKEVEVASARYSYLAGVLAEMHGYPLMTPKGTYAPRVTVEVVRTLFGVGKTTVAEAYAWASRQDP